MNSFRPVCSYWLFYVCHILDVSFLEIQNHNIFYEWGLKPHFIHIVNQRITPPSFKKNSPVHVWGGSNPPICRGWKINVIMKSGAAYTNFSFSPYSLGQLAHPPLVVDISKNEFDQLMWVSFLYNQSWLTWLIYCILALMFGLM